MLTQLVDGFGRLEMLRYCQDSVHVMAAYAPMVPLKVCQLINDGLLCINERCDSWGRHFRAVLAMRPVQISYTCLMLSVQCWMIRKLPEIAVARI
jgi:hypothetical protein